MTNIERVQNEGFTLLQSSGWAQEKINSLKDCLIDFTSQAYDDEMFEEATLRLGELDKEPSLEMVLTIKHIRAKVSLYENYDAFWAYFTKDDKEGQCIGMGSNCKFTEEEDDKLDEDKEWADYFYWTLVDILENW